MIALMILGIINGIGAASAEPASAFTNLVQLCQLPVSEPTLANLTNLDGTVLWSSEAEGTLILQDSSGIAELELDLACPMPRQGDCLRLAGCCTVVKTRDVIKLSSVPVVENDGLHAMLEKSGSVYLKSGLHPIRVEWFNRTDKFGLEVECASPNLLRQGIPDAALFRIQPGSTNGATNFVNGLDYRDYEGMWWNWLPNYSHLSPLKTGVSSNFDISVKSRAEHVGLQFSGYLQISKEDSYTFYTKSDDGSRLFIGDPSLRVTVIGTNTLPSPHSVGHGSANRGTDEFEWSEIEGTVTSVSHLKDHLEAEIATDLGSVLMKTAENSDSFFVLLPQNRIRAVGVCRNMFHVNGTEAPGELFVQGWNDIQQLYVSPDIWAAYPLMTIHSVVAANFDSDSQPVVHLSGNIVQTGAGQAIYLDDGSGRINLETTDAIGIEGKPLELLGRVNAVGTNLVVHCVLVRHMGEASDRTGALPILTTAEQVNQLNAKELKRGYPVRLQGVITAALWGDAIIIQDTTRGIYVEIGAPNSLRPGDYCEVEGIATPGEFTPYIKASQIKNLGAGVLPNPVRPTWDRFFNGSLQNQYVELEGVVTAIEGDMITLLTHDGRIKVGLYTPIPALTAASYKNALVCIRGCLFISWDRQSHRLDVGKVYINESWISLVQPAPKDIFALPTKRADDLLLFDPEAGGLQRVKVSGQVIYAGKTESYLMDGNKGLKFIPAETPAIQAGDLVEVVGFPDLTGSTPFIKEAEVRNRGAAAFPKARKLEAKNLIRNDYDSSWVQIEGELLAVNSTPDGYALDMQAGAHRFTANVKNMSGLNEPLVPGSELKLTGVYVGLGGNRVLGQPIDSFQLLLNSEADIRVLTRPTWWTLRRLLVAVGLLGGVLIATLVWVWLLRRKVTQRTVLLESQIQKRQRAERQGEIEQERARIAQDLHDDLGAGLTRINILTSLVGGAATTSKVKTQYLANLKEIARDMVTSLDEIVWALNPRNDNVASLVGYFGAHAQGLLALASVNFGLDVAEELPDAPINSKFRHAVLMAFKEAITNVVHHSGATKVWLQIRVENEVLIMEVADNGCGFNPNQPMAGGNGLSNMQLRLRNLGGSCSIQSEPEKGTTIRLEAPLSKSNICI